jgi:hypothetical protein
MRFDIFSDERLIGRSDFERGDAPMGCAEGRFVPEIAYDSVKSKVIASVDSSQDDLILSVRTSSGELLDPVGGVRLIDLSSELGDKEGLCVLIMGVGYPAYERLFPEHVQAYESSFPAG